MARTRPARTAALKQIIRTARPPKDEFIVYRGSIDKTAVRGEILFRPHLSLTREWAVFRAKDLVAPPIPVPAAQRARLERSHDIFEILVRKGSRARHVQEWLYPVGTFQPPRGIEDHTIAASAEDREAIKTAVSRLFGTSGARASYGALAHGLILRGPSAAEFTLQTDPGDRRQWAAIRIADVIEPDALLPIPRDLLPARLHRFALYFVPLRTGAIVRTMWEKERIVSVSSNYGPPDGGHRPGTAIASQGDCDEVMGTCPPSIGGSGYPCGSPGTFCRHFGVFPCSGTCTTVSSSWWQCRCDCC
jgi:hypothetical protein